MKNLRTFEEFVNENAFNEGMTFAEIKDKYLDNPYSIGADAIEYMEGKNGNSSMLIFRGEDKYGRDQIESKLKALGIPAKKMRKSTADKAFKYRYELTLFESVINENNKVLNPQFAAEYVADNYEKDIKELKPLKRNATIKKYQNGLLSLAQDAIIKNGHDKVVAQNLAFGYGDEDWPAEFITAIDKLI